LTLEGRPLRYFLRRGNGLRAFFNHANQAFNRLITFSYTNRNNQRQRLAKKTAIWPKLARSITGRRRGDTPPSRSHPAASGLPSPQGLRPSAASDLTPQMKRLRRGGLGEPGACAWRKAKKRQKVRELARGQSPLTLPNQAAPARRPARSSSTAATPPQQVLRQEEGRSGWPVERERPSSVKET